RGRRSKRGSGSRECGAHRPAAGPNLRTPACAASRGPLLGKCPRSRLLAAARSPREWVEVPGPPQGLLCLGLDGPLSLPAQLVGTEDALLQQLADSMLKEDCASELKVHLAKSLPLPSSVNRPRIDLIVFVVNLHSKYRTPRSPCAMWMPASSWGRCVSLPQVLGGRATAAFTGTPW
uniref:Centromere protein M n=1 Tax=Macaca fascicularis TaxID=9541 RepID=A0A7N9CCS0_MACFA